VTVTAISLADKSLYTTQTITVSATVTPANFTNPLSWTIANSSIATITPVSGSKDCKVESKTAGTTTLTVSVDGKTANCTLTVLAPTITLSNQSIYIGDIVTVAAVVSPSTLTITPNWTIANSSIATITPVSGSNQCKVTGIAAGTTQLTITANGGTATCDITVNSTSVLINGVTWSTRNVDISSTFAATPESLGMFYQWNRNVGWKSSGRTPTNQYGSTVWNYDMPTGTTWSAGYDPSPSGWRVPTKAELETLFNTSKVTSVWTTQSGINGRLFTDIATGKTLFLPAAGWRYSGDGGLESQGSGGRYWSSTQFDKDFAYYLSFSSSTSPKMNNVSRCDACSVRPVKK
jgi:uncharacterized protein (TIGR02145 family)